MFILISALMLPFTLNAQTARDTSNTEGANTEGGALDPETKAREQQKDGAAARGLEDQGGGRIR